VKQEEYEAFVARIEQESERNPAAYTFKLGGMAVLGYAYIAVVLLALLAALGLFVWMCIHGQSAAVAVKLGLLILFLVWAVVRAMFVRIEPPAGRRIERADAPALFDLVEEVRREVRSPPVRHLRWREELPDAGSAADAGAERRGIPRGAGA
jgi:uncharacterized membrane protein YeiB